MSNFDVSVQQLDGLCQVAVVGELDITTAPVFRERLAAAHGVALIDCSELTLLDSTGLSELVMLAKRGVTITLVKPSRIVRRVVEVTGLAEVFSIID
jgi:stage II sporulation protein AA (anti-sigma F factor antagonist)